MNPYSMVAIPTAIIVLIYGIYQAVHAETDGRRVGWIVATPILMIISPLVVFILILVGVVVFFGKIAETAARGKYR